MVDHVTDAQKLMVLCLLVLQNASVVIMGRYSRGVMKESYLGSTVVIATEFVKMFLSSVFIFRGMGNSHLNSKQLPITSKLWWLVRNSSYTWVPATCYFIQNTLQYTALENLSSSVYAVMAQMKILTAAIFSFCILRKHLGTRKWRALILLVVGGILMENHTFEIHQRNDVISTNTSDPIKGTIAIVSIVCLSGLAGVVTQLLLKNPTHTNGGDPPPQVSLWDRNFQMAFWSISFGCVTLFFDADYISNNGGFFGGWTMNTWILVFLWAIGGILVALCIKYTDVIIKGFASAVSLIFISIVGSTLLGDSLDVIFVLGAVITVIATFNYNEQDAKPATSKPIASALLPVGIVGNGGSNSSSNDDDLDGGGGGLGGKGESNDNKTVEIVSSTHMSAHANSVKNNDSTTIDTNQTAETRPLLRNTDD